MLQHTSLDDFLRGLYVKAVESPGTSQPRQSHHDKLLSQLMGTTTTADSDANTKDSAGPQLQFDD